MAISQWTAAKTICECGDWQVSNLALQKILYIADMIYIGRHGVNSPLIEEDFEAWDYGPVLPDLYHRAKMFGSGPVRDIFYGINAATGEEGKFLVEACGHLIKKSPRELVSITHWKDGAWAKHYHTGYRGARIPRKDILAEYIARTGEAKKRAHVAA